MTSLSIRGYASLFGQRDLGGDVVTKGAFLASLLSQSDRAFPMLLSHSTRHPIGVWDRVVEDEKGLWVEGRLLATTKRAQNARALVEAGALSGLSIGYKATRSQRTQAGRHLTELDLFEISIVAFPMLRDARLHISQS